MATTFICKICKVPVISKTDFSAKLGYEHKRCCPRRIPANSFHRKVK